MKTYQFVWRMICYRPWLYLVDMVLWACIHISPILPGLIAQQFFNTLSAQKQLSGDIWLLIVLLLATASGRVVLVFGGALADIPHRFIMSSLLRHNLLQRILERPGARAVPDSQVRLSAAFVTMQNMLRISLAGRLIVLEPRSLLSSPSSSCSELMSLLRCWFLCH